MPGLIFKLASTSLVFNYTNPIELREDQTELGKLSEFDRRTSFVFKVRKMIVDIFPFKPNPKRIFTHFPFLQPNCTQNAKRVMFLVIPCGYPVKMKVSSVKRLKKIEDINTATILRFNNPRDNERFMLKFTSANLDEGSQRSKCVCHRTRLFHMYKIGHSF